jgi:hypothetical protein
MTFDDDRDPILRQLARLPVATPEADRSERVRARCAAGLARRHTAPNRIAAGGRGRPLLELALVGGLCVFYLSVVIGDALRLWPPR